MAMLLLNRFIMLNLQNLGGYSKDQQHTILVYYNITMY